METVYKVVRKNGSKLESCVIPTNAKMCMEYKPKTLIKRLSGIFAFKDLPIAKSFKDYEANNSGRNTERDKFEIWECEATLIKKKVNTIHYSDVAEINSQLTLISRRRDSGRSNPPRGTVFCKEITLKKKIM